MIKSSLQWDVSICKLTDSPATTVILSKKNEITACSTSIITRIMVTIKKRAGVIPYIFSSSIALLSSLLSCSFYLLDLRTISSVDILEMT